MANLELNEETKKGTSGPAAADLLIAVAAPVNVEELRAATTEAIRSMSPKDLPEVDPSLSGLRAAVAFPGIESMAPSQNPDSAVHLDPAGSGAEVRFIPVAAPGQPSGIPWLGSSSACYAIFSVARELGVSACAVVAADLATFQAGALQSLLAPVLENRCDLSIPIYPMGKFEGLLNSSILAPLTRALYGKRVLFPLAQDFSVSARLLSELEQPAKLTTSQGRTLFWPATEASLRGRSICQTYLDLHHPASDTLDVSTVLAQTVGPLFAEMEANAVTWQRVRGSQSVETSGVAPPSRHEDNDVDVRPMVETFSLAYRNLQEMWSLVLPPVTLLELKRLTRMNADHFRMPDDLWVRIVYDFALAYRLRTLSRTHLLGALTPLYLAWVASHVMEVGRMRQREVEQRVERLARAYEDGKPYLLSRWRWPDRFNP